MAQRVTYRRRLSYNTRSNRVRIVKTPGMRLIVYFCKDVWAWNHHERKFICLADLFVMCYWHVGGKLTWLYEKKPAKGPRCGDCGITLPGVSVPTIVLETREGLQVQGKPHTNRGKPGWSRTRIRWKEIWLGGNRWTRMSLILSEHGREERGRGGVMGLALEGGFHRIGWIVPGPLHKFRGGLP